ncbi:hypothetical protein J6590_096688, partial [Homalodisca vitripennis]
MRNARQPPSKLGRLRLSSTQYTRNAKGQERTSKSIDVAAAYFNLSTICPSRDREYA